MARRRFGSNFQNVPGLRRDRGNEGYVRFRGMEYKDEMPWGKGYHVTVFTRTGSRSFEFHLKNAAIAFVQRVKLRRNVKFIQVHRFGKQIFKWYRF